MKSFIFIIALFVFLFSPVLLIVAMIAPKWVNKHIKREFTRKEYLQYLTVTFIVALGIALFAVPPTTSNPQNTAQISSPSPEISNSEETRGVQESSIPTQNQIAPATFPNPSPLQSPTPMVKPTELPTPKPTINPIPKASLTPTFAPKSTGGSWECNCKKTCAQMSSCDEAQYQLNTCACGARDADKDGVACDSDCQ